VRVERNDNPLRRCQVEGVLTAVMTGDDVRAWRQRFQHGRLGLELQDRLWALVQDRQHFQCHLCIRSEVKGLEDAGEVPTADIAVGSVPATESLGQVDLSFIAIHIRREVAR
jgi:hypothetical protein